MEKRKHVLYDHPYLGGIVAIIITYIFIIFSSYILVGLVSKSTDIDFSIALDSFAILFSAIALLIHRNWFKKDNYKGFLAFRRLDKEIWIYTAVALVVDIAIHTLVNNNFWMPPLIQFIPGIFAGAFEETSYRAIPISIMMRNKPTYRRMIVACIITAVVFGVSHLVNIVSGATITNTLIQIFFAIGPGLFFAAIYLRTGSIIIPMIFHALHDELEVVFAPQLSDKPLLMANELTMGEILPDVFFSLLLLGIAVYLLRKSKWEDIQATWADIWSE